MTIKDKVNKIVELLENKKGINIDVINIGKVTILADYFILCSGTSSTHVKGLADEVDFRLKEDHGIECSHEEGYETARWILMDYGDIVIHIFHEQEREFYSLERLWQDGNFEYRSARK
jgi:ribosome-associated protein